MVPAVPAVNSSKGQRLIRRARRSIRRAPVSAYRLVLQRNKRLLPMQNPKRYLASIAHRAKLEGPVATGSSGKAPFRITWFAVSGSIAIFARQGGRA
jgi:hypothetical protein